MRASISILAMTIIGLALVWSTRAGAQQQAPQDLTVMVDGTSHMFITGPDVIKTVTGEDIGFEELGGGRTHNTKSGNAHYLASDETDAIDYVRALLSYLPQNSAEEPPRGAPDSPGAPDPGACLPASSRRVYDVGAVAHPEPDADGRRRADDRGRADD